MPTFFNPDNLTPQQALRYDVALAEYARVMAANRDALNTQGQTCGNTRPRNAFADLHRPGPKSALFARLLEGKPALLSAPPTSYGYPWFAIIEDGRASGIDIGGAIPVAGALAGLSESGCQESLLINQCPWGIISANDAATELMSLARAWAILDMPLEDTRSDVVRSILRQRPEWIVQYRQCGPYRVYLGRTHAQGRRDVLMRDRLYRDFTGGNPVIKSVLQPYRQQRARELERVAQLRAKAPEALAEFERLMLLGEENYVAPPQPEDWDWVVVERDGWCIESVARRSSAPPLATTHQSSCVQAEAA